LTVLDDVTVLVEGLPDVEITAAHAQRDNDLIATLMKGDYGMIVDRKADYSIVPVQVYRILNGMPRLRAVAIVSHRPLTTLSAATERPLYKGHFMSFGDVESAHAWILSVVKPPSVAGAPG
jgi:hypothetical protein